MRAGCSRGRNPGHAHMRFCISDFDVFSDPTLNSLGGADEPFNSRCQMPSPDQVKNLDPGWKLRLLFRSRGMSSLQEGWWSQTGSNRRPHACKARALPTELWPQFPREFQRPVPAGSRHRSVVRPPEGHTKCGGPRRTRTADLTLIRRVL